jgi:hypothetical protein
MKMKWKRSENAEKTGVYDALTGPAMVFRIRSGNADLSGIGRYFHPWGD